MKKIFFALLSLYSFQAYSQDIQKRELDVVRHRKKAVDFFMHDDRNGKLSNGDVLADENEIFKKKLYKLTAQDPASLTYPFNKLREQEVYIVTSPDKKFRIYSWDTMTGGTMHFFDNVFQFQSGKKVFSLAPKYLTEQAESGPWYSELYEIDIADKKAYFGIYHLILSNSQIFQAVKAFTIENNKLNDKFELFNSGSSRLNEINFEFNFFSVVDRKERPVKLIEYNPKTKILKIPVVLDDGKVTKRFITYKFTGRYFEYKRK